jgi:hypothetical protein
MLAIVQITSPGEKSKDRKKDMNNDEPSVKSRSVCRPSIYLVFHHPLNPHIRVKLSNLRGSEGSSDSSYLGSKVGLFPHRYLIVAFNNLWFNLVLTVE